MSRRLKVILRSLVLTAGGLLVFCLVDYEKELHFLGSYDRIGIVLCTAVIFVCARLAPAALIEGWSRGNKL